MGNKFEPKSFEEACKEPGVTHQAGLVRLSDNRRETRLYKFVGDDGVFYDFERGGWETVPGMAAHAVAVEDRWRKIEEEA